MKNQNDIKEFVIKNKRLFMVAPLILVLFFSLLYFNVQAKGNESKYNSGVDNSLPEAATKELPDSKLDTYNEYDKYVDGLEKDKQRNDGNLNGIGFDLLSEKDSLKSDSNVYNQPSDAVAERMKEMIEKMEEKQSSKKRSSPSNISKSSYKEVEESEESIVKTTTSSKKSSEKPSSSKSGFFKNHSLINSNINSDLEIYACVHSNQKIKNNQRVKFRTTKSFTYKGKQYPINTMVYGVASIKPNRLIVKINRINQTELDLEVYDSEDSNRGLYVLTPNLNASLKQEAQKEGIAEEDLSGIPLSRSLKRIFDKKIKEETVELLNNYKILIKIAPDEEY